MASVSSCPPWVLSPRFQNQSQTHHLLIIELWIHNFLMLWVFVLKLWIFMQILQTNVIKRDAIIHHLIKDCIIHLRNFDPTSIVFKCRSICMYSTIDSMSLYFVYIFAYYIIRTPTPWTFGDLKQALNMRSLYMLHRKCKKRPYRKLLLLNMSTKIYSTISKICTDAYQNGAPRFIPFGAGLRPSDV